MESASQFAAAGINPPPLSAHTASALMTMDCMEVTLPAKGAGVHHQDQGEDESIDYHVQCEPFSEFRTSNCSNV